jgi:outer membrane immunogenic protein
VKRLLLVGVAAGMLGGVPALAAPPSAPFNWTGFYIGGQVGGGWSNSWHATTNELPNPGAFGALPLSFSQKGEGLATGGQVGLNWQIAPTWVLGIEADLFRLHIDADSVGTIVTLAGVPLNCAGGQPNCGLAMMNRDLHWIGTVRGRLGYAWDRWLAYFTGGFAYGRVSYSANFFNFTDQFPASFASTKTGWTVGGGIEYALPSSWGNWTIRGEYLFVSLGSASAIVPEVPAAPPFALRYDWNRTDVHIARFGLNYKFGI